jgi:hypothetical protein
MAIKKAEKPAKAPHPATAGLPSKYIWDDARDGTPPAHWPRITPLIPCERCRATRNTHAQRAVSCYGHSQDRATVYLRCRVCHHRFTMQRASVS